MTTVWDLFSPDGASRRAARAARRRLDQAAPDLLEACRMTEAATAHSIACVVCEAFFAGHGPRCYVMATLSGRAREARRAAIARAEGK